MGLARRARRTYRSPSGGRFGVACSLIRPEALQLRDGWLNELVRLAVISAAAFRLLKKWQIFVTRVRMR
jgi:hypothetical protein